MPVTHYIPPDFDPRKAMHRTKPRNGQHQLRFMLPMAIQCSNCGEYMHAGTKVNCRKEVCQDEKYLGCINIYRIYMHCKACYSEIVIKTDPQNLDYQIEKGGTRHFEPWRNFLIQQAKEEKEQMKGSFFQQAEAETVDMAREMEHMHELERLRHISAALSDVKLETLPETEDESPQILTELDRQRIELFEVRKMDELHIEHKPLESTASNSGNETPPANPFISTNQPKKNFFAHQSDEDEF